MLVLVYFSIGYSVHSFLFSSPGCCTALLFRFSIPKCIKHYPIAILHNCQRVPYSYEDPTPIYCLLLPPFLFLIFSNIPQPCSFCCLDSLADWVIVPHLMYHLLNDNMDHNLPSLVTLVPARPCFAFYLLRHQIYWRFASAIIGYCTHRQTQTAATRIIEWNTHKDILTSPVTCIQQPPVLQWMTKLLYRSFVLLATIIIIFFLSPQRKEIGFAWNGH